jgi:hypothetical protein
MADDHGALEYEQINESIRFLADVRFKLIALFPATGAIAAFAFGLLGFDTARDAPASVDMLPFILAAGVLGFVISLGVTLYDQRNSEIYNALLHRAKHLEGAWNQPHTPGALNDRNGGGQFRERPRPLRRLLLQAKHDVALALIYGSILGAWWFPIFYAAIGLLQGARSGSTVVPPGASAMALVLSAALAVVFITALLMLDAQDRSAYGRANRRDNVNEPSVPLVRNGSRDIERPVPSAGSDQNEKREETA